MVASRGGPLTAEAAPSSTPSISNISVNAACDTQGGFTGTVTLSASFTGSVTLGLFYHLPGGAQFLDSAVRTTATFTNSGTASYAFGAYTGPAGTNSYRIQVIDAAGLGGATVKSNSVNPCTPTSPPPPTCTVPGATGPSFLGLCSPGSVQDTGNGGSPNGSKITTGSKAETVSSICADVVAVAPAPYNHYIVSIYADASGTPSTLVAQSVYSTLTGPGWNCAAVTASLAANTTYWLLFNADADGPVYNNLYYNQVSTNVGVFSEYFPGRNSQLQEQIPTSMCPDWCPFAANAPAALGPWQFSIFANVSP
jgi:hypothetical protein